MFYIFTEQQDFAYYNQKEFNNLNHNKRPIAMVNSALLEMLVVVLLITWSSSVVIFQKSNFFGAIQIQLTTSEGFISTGTSKSFYLPNPGYSNLSTLGLALCGFDIPNPNALQFSAEASYDDSSNNFVILILPINSTRFVFINYFLMIVTTDALQFLSIQNACFQAPNPSSLNAFQVYTTNSPFISSTSNPVAAIPYITSVKNIVANTYNFLNIASISSISNWKINITLFTNYSIQAEVCLSILFYDKTAAQNNSFVTAAYSSNFLLINSSNPAQNLAVAAQQNFTISNSYGPVFNYKCLVGFQTFKMLGSIRQTISFNMTGNGLYGLISSSSYQITYNWFCIAYITCQGVAVRYYPLINDCQPNCQVASCLLCSTATTCQTCISGYFGNALYRCSNCIANCLNCSTSTDCNLCVSGYYYNSSVSTCLPCSMQCLSCNNNNFCSSCSSGYYVNSGRCILCSSVLANCVLCNFGTDCAQCPAAYYNGGYGVGCAPCANIFVGCSSCANNRACQACNIGYYLNVSTCRPCVFTVPLCCPYFIANCTICSNQSTCSNCAVGYFLTSGNQSCSSCSLNIQNCLTCSSQSACSNCVTNFTLNSQLGCTLCSNFIPACLTCANVSYCLTCSLPYLMVLGSCLDCPIWPMNNLYYLDVNNVCQLCSTLTPYCIQCTNNLNCIMCSGLYFLNNNGVCISCPDNIQNCYSCINGTFCQICFNGYYVSYANPDQCLQCSLQVSNCLSCIQVANPSFNSSVVSCTICEPEYYINNSICSPCIQSIPFCLVCANNFQCRQCQSGYFISTASNCITCIDLISGCNLCNSSSTCLECVEGYYLINNYCTLCMYAINNCYYCAPLNGNLTCSSCLVGYYLGLNFTCQICNATLQFCSMCSSPTVCTGCISGFIVNYNNTCSPCSFMFPYCEYCTTQCQQCILNYIIDNFGDCNSCSIYITGCQVCNYTINNVTLQNQLNCSQCLKGYLLYQSGTLGQCVACNTTIPNCNNCLNLSYCQSCNTISFLNAQNTCSLCSLYIPFCLYCNSSYSCSACSQNYYLNANQTCSFCDSSQFGNDGTVLKISLCQNCIYQSNLAVCLSCIIGYYLSSNTCLQCSNVISNCQSCATSSLCISCQSGFYLSATNSECIPCPSNLVYCAHCTALGVCTQCESDCYLNATLNQCFQCSLHTKGCATCNNNATCESCIDGYYMQGASCLSCSAAISNCILCNNQTVCLLYQPTQTTTSSSIFSSLYDSTWQYVSIGFFGFLLLLLIIFIIYRRYFYKVQEKEKQNENTTKSNTQRQLISQDLSPTNDVEIDNKNSCQNCKRNNFDLMSVELLCRECERKPRSKDHIIRKQVAKNKDRNKQRTKQKNHSQTKPKLEREANHNGKSQQYIPEQNAREIKKKSTLTEINQPSSKATSKINKKQVKSHI